ncbi:hypothetical protein DdX_03307 [Ditylenchus destructor]|uniref:Uncharacterized protein n=1 Tax=Ditylenchus destructor TaxID=166010 RepID=A0AAD4R9W8_9BILA|nr:hypothetical protein DdX_03307 [Ditylenchus destructor]
MELVHSREGLVPADFNPANNDDLKISLMDLLTAAAAAGNEVGDNWCCGSKSAGGRPRDSSRALSHSSLIRFLFYYFAVVDSGGGGSSLPSVDELWFIGWLVRRQRLFREKYPPSAFLVPRICGGLPPQPSILISLTCPKPSRFMTSPLSTRECEGMRWSGAVLWLPG